MARTSHYVKVGEGAACLGVSANTLRRWGAAGKLSGFRRSASNYGLYGKAELDQFLSQTGSAPTADQSLSEVGG